LEKRDREDSDDDEVAIKRPREMNKTSPPVEKLNTFGLPQNESPKKTKTEVPVKKKKSKEVIKMA